MILLMILLGCMEAPAKQPNQVELDLLWTDGYRPISSFEYKGQTCIWVRGTGSDALDCFPTP